MDAFWAPFWTAEANFWDLLFIINLFHIWIKKMSKMDGFFLTIWHLFLMIFGALGPQAPGNLKNRKNVLRNMVGNMIGNMVGKKMEL